MYGHHNICLTLGMIIILFILLIYSCMNCWNTKFNALNLLTRRNWKHKTCLRFFMYMNKEGRVDDKPKYVYLLCL